MTTKVIQILGLSSLIGINGITAFSMSPECQIPSTSVHPDLFFAQTGTGVPTPIIGSHVIHQCDSPAADLQ